MKHTSTNTNEYKHSSLDSEFWLLFLKANTHRSGLGITRALQSVAAKEHPSDDGTNTEAFEDLFPKGTATSLCPTGHGKDETCSACDAPLETLCNVSEALDLCGGAEDPLNNIADLLLSVKREDFQAAVSAYYAPVGQMPGILNPPAVTDLPDDELKEIAGAFWDNIQAYLDETEMTVEDIPAAFEFNTILDLMDNLHSVAMGEVESSVNKATQQAQKKLSEFFGRVRFMKQYQQVLDDITEYPIAGLWCTHKLMNKSVKISGNKVKVDEKTLPQVERIDPCYLWLTTDWRKNKTGRAVFTLQQVDCSMFNWCRSQTKNEQLLAAIDSIDETENGHRLNTGHLFKEDLLPDGTFDVLKGRGRFKREDLEDYVDGLSKGCEWIDAEVWMIDQKVIYVKVLPEWVEVVGSYGVFLTRFRDNGDSPWGLSLNDFLRPFALMFEGALKGINSSVKKTMGSVVSIDVSVIENPDTQFQRDATTGEVHMDLAGDTIIPFASDMAVGSPNFKGKPIHIDKFPTDLPQLQSTISLVLAYMELFSGIPSILSTGNPDSSAVRTDKSYETAHRSAAKKPASILANSKDSVLEPAVRFFYYAGIDLQIIGGEFLSGYPEIMLDERLAKWISNQRNMAATLNDLGPFAAQIPEDRIASFVNLIARTNGIEEDIVPETNPVGNSTSTPASPGEL